MTRDFTFGATDCHVDMRTRGAVAIAEAWVIETDGGRRRLARFRAHDAERALALAALDSGAPVREAHEGARAGRRHVVTRIEEGPVVKRLRHDAAGWWLVSENEAYAPRPWPADAAVLGQVMWTGRSL